MRKLSLVFAILMVLCLETHAQLSLAGRVYYAENLLPEEKDQMRKDTQKIIAKEKDEDAKKELSGSERVMDAVQNKLTVKFLDDKNLQTNAVITFDEAKAKQLGVSWIVRKAFKLKIGKGIEKTLNYTYTLNGRHVKAYNKQKNRERNYEVSEDGRQLVLIDDNNKRHTLKMLR